MAAAGSVASATELQGHVQELHQQLPVLCLDMAPNGLSNAVHLASLEGPQQQAAVQQLLAAARGRECQLCGTKSKDVDLLLCTRLQFAGRLVEVTAGHIACGACRLASSTTTLVQEADAVLSQCLDTSSSSGSSPFHHLAAVNSAPQHITANPEALARWGQELLCRVYAMRVVASSMRGWRLSLSGGRLLAPGQQGMAAALVQAVLLQQEERQQHARQEHGQQEAPRSAKKGRLEAGGNVQTPAAVKGTSKRSHPQQQTPQAPIMPSQSPARAAQASAKKHKKDSSSRPVAAIGTPAAKGLLTPMTSSRKSSKSAAAPMSLGRVQVEAQVQQRKLKNRLSA